MVWNKKNPDRNNEIVEECTTMRAEHEDMEYALEVERQGKKRK